VRGVDGSRRWCGVEDSGGDIGCRTRGESWDFVLAGRNGPQMVGEEVRARYRRVALPGVTVR